MRVADSRDIPALLTLINILEGNHASPDPVRVVLKSELVLRDSTARIAPAR